MAAVRSIVPGVGLALLAGAPATAQAPIDRDAAALVQAAPHEWAAALQRLRAHGAAVTEPLVRALTRDPLGPGVQLALAVLGAHGDARAAEAVIPYLEHPAPLAEEAALALGRLGAPDAVPTLVRRMADPGADPVTRTACAAALLDLGQREPAAEFLAAVLLAGQPDGRAARRRFALPDKPRWAHERYLAIEAIRRLTGGETFDLDPDASWPALAEGVTAFRQWLRER